MLEVVIPFYKNHTQLSKCKEHLKASGQSVQLYVHDNSEKNIGFTRAVNEGLLQSLETPHPYILVVNQDLYLEPDAISEMVKFLDDHPDFGIVAPIQVDGDEVKSAGGAQIFPNGYNFCGTTDMFQDPFSVFWVEGACWLLRKKMVREIGVLDKNMVMFCSDSDYCLRARMANWIVGVVPSAKCFHERGCTKDDAPKCVHDQKRHDATYFHAKWMSGDLYRMLDYKPKVAPRQVLGKSFMEGSDA